MIINNSMPYKFMALCLLVILSVVMTGCVTVPHATDSSQGTATTGDDDYRYFIGPGDKMDVFVWRNPELSVEDIPVRPDGRISTPLVEDQR